MTMPANNMALWDRVQETDPKFTKKVNQRGGFTTINAQYTVMRATEAFGPIGRGWGYDVVHSVMPAGQALMAVTDVTIWHGERANTFGPIRTMNELVSANGRVDDDAAKKAMTDAITKGLSQLGFSADVFLGQYDDNKYLAGLHAKHGASRDNAVTPGVPANRPGTQGGQDQQRRRAAANDDPF